MDPITIGAALAIIGSLLKLAIMVYEEYKIDKKLKRERQEKHILDQKLIWELFAKAVIKGRKEAAKDSGDAYDVEDQIDRELRGGGPVETKREGNPK
jgi:hypothetical protein